MPFCMKCGKNIPDEAEFCFGCGAKVVVQEKNDSVVQKSNSERREEWAGKVIKCPSCGEILQSFTAICPSCGHEIIANRKSSAIDDFLNQLNDCDYLITAKEANPTTNDKVLRYSIITMWFLLNLYLYAIPLLIKHFYTLLGKSNLNSEEKRKALLIENYTFPNEREVILEALLFTKNKMDSLSSEKNSVKNTYWINLWSKKGQQLYNRTEILFKDDTIANKAYQDILTVDRRFKRRIIIKRIVTIVLICFLIKVRFSAHA